MNRTGGRAALLVAGVALALSLAACGKKAPLRLSDERTAERAPAIRARVREDRVTLDFRVPAHRSFPEREDPWVLARILRQAGPTAEVVEAGAILMAGGFVFDSALTWSEQVAQAGSALVYRVEFRDAVRRRRALTEPLAVSLERVPDGPSTLVAAGRLRSIVLEWKAPEGTDAGVVYRIYRRELATALPETDLPDTVAGLHFIDSRVEPGRDYCYRVRAVRGGKNVESEGPASPESCSRPASEELPPEQPARVSP